MKYLDIVIDNRSRATDNFFTYACEDDDIRIGQKVYVTFGKSRSLRAGYVFRVNDTYEGDYELKSIEAVDENISLTEEMVRTCIWMKKRYLIRYIDGIRCFVPSGRPPVRELKQKKSREITEGKKNLTDEQANALKIIGDSLDKGQKDIFLVHGVTSSGKTEVYMQTIEKVIAMGKTAVMMVPEVALTKEIIARFENRFGSDIIAVMHYKMTAARRHEQWQKIRSEEKKIVIGARSAVFAPLENIGVIILDEEHELTYKSDMTPKYDTVDVAVKRAYDWNGVVLLGSATPSVVSKYRAKKGIYKEILLKNRYNNNKMPIVDIVDMSDERRNGNMKLFSKALAMKMEDCLKEGKQVMLLLNRRGFSTYVMCDSCGHVLRCRDCGISLTYHKDSNSLKCHFCGRSYRIVNECPECGSPLSMKGSGTQKLEEETQQLFPDYRFDRLDFDKASAAGETERILSDFRTGKTHILMGTQMIAKGLDFDNVGLVGIISADNELNIPDYRSPERTFQLITQAAGRAGRGDFRGAVVIQSFMGDNYSIEYAASNNYDGFYEEEIKLREMMNYPPFSDIIKVLFTGKNEEKTLKQAEEFYDYIKGRIPDIQMYKPKPSPMSKIKETYRYQTLIKAPQGKRKKDLEVIEEYIDKIKRNNMGIVVDINPYSFT